VFYNIVFKHVMGRKAKEIIDLSSSLADIWRVLSEEERDLIRKNARFVHYKKNEAIYIEEEQPQDLMCLLKGKVKIFKNGVGE
jgi:CRP-like cAMP-binding protein